MYQLKIIDNNINEEIVSIRRLKAIDSIARTVQAFLSSVDEVPSGGYDIQIRSTSYGPDNFYRGREIPIGIPINPSLREEARDMNIAQLGLPHIERELERLREEAQDMNTAKVGLSHIERELER